MKRMILALALVVLLVGVVGAAGTIKSVQPLDLGEISFIAGSSNLTSFSFDYPDVEENYNNAPLVARINISCLDKGGDCPLPSNDCSVWKGDFQFSMIAKQYLFGDLFGNLIYYNTIPMQCKEDAPIQFKAKDNPDIQYSINEIPNGTFYCYNPNYYMMQLDSHDDITLSISSDPALYPGQYSISVELMEMGRDSSPPVMELILDEFIFGENDTIPIKLNVSDMYNIDSVEYEIMNPSLSDFYSSGWIEVFLNEDSGLYEDDFNMTVHELNKSGDYWIKARACDVLGNCGEL